MAPKRRKRPGQGAPDNPQQQRAAVIKAKGASAQAAGLVADLRFRHRVQYLVERLGSRVTAELLAKIASEHDCRPEIERFIDRCIEREETIRKLGFDRWPDLPLRAVPR